MRKFWMAAVLTASALPLMAQPGLAQNNSRMQSQMTTGETTMGQLSPQQFVDKAAVGNMFEIQSSQLAENQAKNQEIKQLAQMLVQDHKKIGNQLESVVKGENSADITIPRKLDREHVQMLQQLKSASAANFDNTYLEMQLNSHKQAIDLFRSYAENGDNSTLKTFAQTTLPTLKTHLEKAQAINLPETATGSINRSGSGSMNR